MFRYVSETQKHVLILPVYFCFFFKEKDAIIKVFVIEVFFRLWSVNITQRG